MKSVINIPASVDICRTILHTKFPYCDHLTKLVFLVKKKETTTNKPPYSPTPPLPKEKNPTTKPKPNQKNRRACKSKWGSTLHPVKMYFSQPGEFPPHEGKG